MNPPKVNEEIKLRVWENAPKRPTFLFVVAIAYLLEPFVKTFSLWASTGLDLGTMFELTHNGSFWRFVEYWLLFPIGGLALLKARRYTFVLFVLVQFFSVFAYFNYQKASAMDYGTIPFLNFILLIIFNIVVLLFISAPNTRRPFFQKRFRFWEFAPRYTITIPCKLIVKNGEREEIEYTEIKNISRTGAFIRSMQDRHLGDELTLSFDFYNFHFTVLAKIVHHVAVEGVDGFGVQFMFADLREDFSFRKFMRAIELLKN